MTARTFKLTEMHQRIDAYLRVEQQRRVPDQGEVSRLMRMKRRIKAVLARLSVRPLTSPALSA